MKGLREMMVDWLFTILTTTIYNHYSWLELKRTWIIKNDVLKLKVCETVNKAFIINQYIAMSTKFI